jgi:hypothetical protein
MHRKRFSWLAVAGIGLAGVGAVSGGASSVAAHSAASPLELAFQARHEPCSDCFPSLAVRHVGTFTSGPPFCASGTAEDVGWFRRQFNSDVGALRHYVCADGSGSLLLVIESLQAEHGQGAGSEWTIDEGSGLYTGLRGKGTSREESMGGNSGIARITSNGFAGTEDATAPSLAFTGASATKLRRPAGAYAIRVAFSLRDDVDGTPVTYRLVVTDGLRVLASAKGATAAGSVTTTVRVRPSSKRVRNVALRLYGSDWIGNEVSIGRSLKLPR